MPLEAELQRADAVPAAGKLQIERLVRVRMERNLCARRNDCGSASARPPNRLIASRAVALAVEQAPNSVCADWPRHRRKWPLRSEAFGEIGELQNLRLKRPAAVEERSTAGSNSTAPAGRLTAPRPVAPAGGGRPAEGWAQLPCQVIRVGSSATTAKRWRQERPTSRAAFWIRAEPCTGFATGRSARDSRVDRHRPAIGDVVDGQSAKDRAVMQRKKSGDDRVVGLAVVRAEYPPDRISGSVDALRSKRG